MAYGGSVNDNDSWAVSVPILLNALELLALANLIECRGKKRKANDEEIEEFASKYC